MQLAFTCRSPKMRSKGHERIVSLRFSHQPQIPLELPVINLAMAPLVPPIRLIQRHNINLPHRLHLFLKPPLPPHILLNLEILLLHMTPSVPHLHLGVSMVMVLHLPCLLGLDLTATTQSTRMEGLLWHLCTHTWTQGLRLRTTTRYT